ncbi:MAG: ATP-binding cassette domain-containing protein [Acidimicrobiales bacterium]
MTSPAPDLSADHLMFRDGERSILADVTFGAPPGRLVTLEAPSGTGSSLVLAILAGLTRPTGGTVRYAGAPIGPDWPSRRAVVEQDHALAPELTAAETVSLPLRAAGLAPRDVRERTHHWMEALRLAPAAGQLVSQLSGGQQQRVALARAFAADTPALLLDDPTAELDADNRANVIDLIRERLAAGAIVVAATHDPDLVAVSDQRLTIEDGQVRPRRPGLSDDLGSEGDGAASPASGS